MAAGRKNKQNNATTSEETMPALENIQISDSNESAPEVRKPEKIFIVFLESAKWTLHMYGRRLRGLFPLLAKVTAEMLDTNSVSCKEDSGDTNSEVRTIVIDDGSVAKMVIEQTVELSLLVGQTASVDDVMEEIAHLLNQVEFFQKNGFAKSLNLEYFRRTAAEVESSLVLAVFGEATEMHKLQIEVAKAADELEEDSVELLEEAIMDIATRKGLDPRQVCEQIAQIWAKCEKPKAKLLEVKRNLQVAPKPANGTLTSNQIREKLAKQSPPTVH